MVGLPEQLRALKDNPGVIFIPPGRYTLTKILRIENSNCVLRGAGPDKTFLYFPKSLYEVEPKLANYYHNHGGFIWGTGDFGNGRKLADIVQSAPLNAREITVDRIEAVSTNQKIEIRKNNRWMVANIRSIDGNTLTIDRDLRFKIDTDFSVYSYEPSVTEVGIEDLTIEFPDVEYKGHFNEEWNAVFFQSLADSWVSNVKVINADEGFMVLGRFCSLLNISVVSKGANRSRGHNAILLDGRPVPERDPHDRGGDNLVQGFDIGYQFMHTLSIRQTAGNVFSKGRGVRINFDCSAHDPYGNLFTEIDVGDGSVAWKGSGRKGARPQCAERNVWWNIIADRDLPKIQYDSGSGPYTVVGISSKIPSDKQQAGDWWEPLKPSALMPQNLYAAQRELSLE